MKHVHLIGIGGTGLSAIALFLKERGYQVTGSDRTMSPLARQLIDQGVTIFAGHDPQNIAGADIIVRSSAIPPDNVEVQAALAQGIPVLKRSDFLKELMAGSLGITVAGTHGKTTTTAMIAWMLSRIGQDPSYIIGGVSKDLGTNAHAGNGPHFVIEADEYDYMFLGLSPEIIIVTNIEHDHPDCFPTPDDYLNAFGQFFNRLQYGGTLLACADDFACVRLAHMPHRRDVKALTYGKHPQSNYIAVHEKTNPRGGMDFDVIFREKEKSRPLASVSLQVPGEHNVLNALAAVAVADQLQLDLHAAAAALAEFSGTGRRFDLVGEHSGITIIDDYAHHPTEVRATLAAARQRYPRARIWAVWQPHTYSRTIALLEEFTSAFKLADRVIVTEVYAAREKQGDFSASQVVERMQHPDARFIPSLAATTLYLMENLREGDVLLVLSAGDADQISSDVLRGLQNKEENHD
jgi:UDP-N-acetylmuramate--alanine ligase